MLKQLRCVLGWTMPALTSLLFFGMLTSTRVSLAQGIPITISLKPTTIAPGGSIVANMTAYLPDFGINLTDSILTWVWPDGTVDTYSNTTPQFGPGLFALTQTATSALSQLPGDGSATYTAKGTDFYGTWTLHATEAFTVTL